MTPQQLREWRQRLGITKAEAARRLGITRRHYDRLEHGEYQITPTIAKLVAVLDPNP